MSVSLVTRKQERCNCIAKLYRAYGDFLEIPEPLIYGAEVNSECQDCHNCSGCRPWKRATRNNVHMALRRAVQTIQNDFGDALCPREETIIVDECDCPIKLQKPVDYLGKRVLIETQEFPICYTFRSGCDPEYTECFDLIGQVVIDDIPNEWDGDFDLLEISYPANCKNTKQCLALPCYDLDCCQTENTTRTPCPQDCNCIEKCVIDCTVTETAEGYCQSILVELLENCETQFIIDERVQIWSGSNFVFGTVTATGDEIGEENMYIISFTKPDTVDCETVTEISVPHLVATWDKFELVKPTRNTAELCVAKPCTQTAENLNAFLDTVSVSFYRIDESAAFEIVQICNCTSCKVCRCGSCDTHSTEDTCVNSDPVFSDYYEYELDKCTGELCITPISTGCTCAEPHRIKITYGVKPDIDDSVQLAIILRALLWSTMHIKCSCNDHDEAIEYWLGDEPGTRNEALATRKHYRFGRTRAGVELLRLYEAYQEELTRKKQKEPKSGMATAKKLTDKRSSRGIHPRRYVNPRSNLYG